jgi:hypothetical protein
MNKKFEEYLRVKGIQHQQTCVYTPQQNGVAERLNRTLLDSTRSLLQESGLPNTFWAEGVANSVYVKNRVSTKGLQNATPYEVFKEKKPTVSCFRIFGCDAFAAIPKEKRKKLDPKSQKLVMLGYDLNKKGYRLWDPKRSQVVISRDVDFNENCYSLARSLGGPDRQMLYPEKDTKQFEVESDDVVQNEEASEDETESDDSENEEDSSDAGSDVTEGIEESNADSRVSSPNAQEEHAQIDGQTSLMTEARDGTADAELEASTS